ncbi:outer membrane autotransporter [Ascobolus immersus RN42]|uniref:Outer membrane autotransporter n=1 Tax=Ascobolus immersus RN42 TaxID=1160509 RepID=A0A3N4IU26_ASCIM|nr:outer membrane autotransporter [Ascobolus immersus RN42]
MKSNHFLSLLLTSLSFTASTTAHPSRPTNEAPLATCSTSSSYKVSYNSLAGFGRLSGRIRDKYGDTVSFGSSLAIEPSSWRLVPTQSTSDRPKGKDSKKKKVYTASAYLLPDRGWNTNGTINYQPRLHKFQLTFDPSVKSGSKPNLIWTYRDTILLKDNLGRPLTGLDPNTSFNQTGWPQLPASTYTGDGYGGEGPGGTRVAIDPEGLALDGKGGYFISDEYASYIYHFDKTGTLKSVTLPPDSIIPRRKGVVSFASNNPPRYDPSLEPKPKNPDSGRANNQGLEGLTLSPSGKYLFTLLQSATIQDGGKEKYTNSHSRLLRYKRVKNKDKEDSWELDGEFVVKLPTYTDPTKKPEENPRTAAQSEIAALSDTQFLVLSRDSNFGRGLEITTSQYRHVDVFDISKASNIFGLYDGATDAVSPGGVLRAGIKQAEYCSLIDFNNAVQIAKFGLENGGNSVGTLNEKWEGIALVPNLEDDEGRRGKKDKSKRYYAIAISDNDFITQDGYFGGGQYRYADGSGAELDNQSLIFEVTLEK